MPRENSHAVAPQTKFVVLGRSANFEQIGDGTASVENVIPLTRIPRTPLGEPDLAALRALPVITPALCDSLERQLSALPGITAAAVMPSQWQLPEVPVHLDDVLPENLLKLPAAVPEGSTGLLATTRTADDAPWALSEFPGLPHANRPATLIDILLTAAKKSQPDDLRFIAADGTERQQSLAELLSSASRILSGLRSKGLVPGCRVVLQLESNADILAAFWACILGGCPPVIFPVPPSYTDASRGRDQLAHVIHTLDSPWIVQSRKLTDSLLEWLQSQNVAVGGCLEMESLGECPPTDEFHRPDPADVAFFSTSSGSTGQPKCVQLTHRGLVSRAEGANYLCSHTADDVILNWLPLDHIGSISDWHLRCVLIGCRMVYVPKEYVISQPLRWLDLIHQFRITHSWAPNFAYSLIRDALSKLNSAENQQRWDLSCVVGLLTAGEAVSPNVVAEFLANLEPFGFASTAIRPAFGMAELGSGITYFIPTAKRPLKFHTIARSTLETGLIRVSPDHPEAITFTDLGGPIPGVAIRIVDAGRNTVREETVGHVHIQGDAVMAGYYRNPAANAVLLDDGWFDTGDLGFLTNGQLVLTGRAKDVIIVNGANYYCGEIEEVVEAVPGVEPSFTVACAPRRPNHDREELVIFFCTSTTSEAEQAKLISRIRQAVVRQVGVKPDLILPVATSQIPKTAIGKLQRSQLSKQFEAGEFDELARRIDLLSHSSRTLPNWFYRRHWQAAHLLPGATRASQVTALIGNNLLLDAMAEKLEADGTRVLRIQIGESFSDLGADHYLIDPLQPGDLELLLESFLWQDVFADHWIVGDADSLRNETSAAAQESTDFTRQMALIQGLVSALAARNDANRELCLTVLSQNAEEIADRDLPEAAVAATRGWLRAAGHEFSWLRCRRLDFDRLSPRAETAAELLRDCAAFPGEREVAFRNGMRSLPRLERVAFSQPPTNLPLQANGHYIVASRKTEFRDVLTEFLTNRYGARLSILDEFPGRDGLQQQLDTVESQVQAAIAGVFFLPAPVPESSLADAATAAIAQDLSQQVLAWHSWLKRRPQTLFVSVASLEALMGGRGRSGESQALSLLDAMNRARSAQRLTYSIWVEPGTPENRQRAAVLRAGGYLEVGPEAWLKSVLAALAHGQTDWVFGLDGQNSYVRRLTTNGDPLVEHLTAFYVADESFDAGLLTSTDWPTDAFGSQLEATWVPLEDFPRDDQGAIDRGRLRRGLLRNQEVSAAPTTEIEQQVAGIFREALGLSSIGLHDNFFELGGHSILLMQVHARLQDLFGPKLQLVDMFKYPSVATLSKALGDDQPAKADSGQAFGKQRADVRRKVRGTDGAAPEVAGVAVVGMACRFPGANSVEEFWQNLRNGVESISFFTAEDALAAGVDPERVRDPRYVNAAPIIPNVEEFDADFFGYTPKEARLMDPQQRVFLECAWEAMEDAGYNPRTCPHSVGIFAGAVMNTYLVNNLIPNRAFVDADDQSEVFTLDSMSGFMLMVANDKDYLTTRISYKLNLRGPSVNVQTACSTSLVAIHMAAQAVLNGECDMALAGGVSVKVPQDTGYLYQSDVIVSPDGHCRAFDANAQGTIFGNGSGAVLLKRVEEAIADGDHIYAVIRGTAFNNDGGNKLGYMAPSQEGQAAVVAEALTVANVPPETIRYIEAHGTGTSLGDPIEIAGLNQGLGTSDRQFCAIGSVKTNLGHLQIASGVAGFMKAVLAIYHGEIPPTLHFETPNPRIKFDQTPFFVNNRLMPWPETDHPRRAGVNSLGIGGANCHVILEQPPVRQMVVDSSVRPRHLLQLSGQNSAALRDLTQRYVDWVDRHPEADLADVCYTANTGRVPLTQRLTVTAADLTELRNQLQQRLDEAEAACGVSVGSGPLPRIAFLFTGQGSQSPGMARRLFETQPTFRRAVEECARLVDGELQQPLLTVLFPEDRADDAIHQTGFAQVALFTVEYALAQLWMSWGVQPAVMIGHSLGDYVAACVAGVFTLAEALKLVAVRSRLMQALPPGGGMAAVSRSISAVEPLLAGCGQKVSVAAINAPQQVVLSGELTALTALVERLERDGTTVHWLKVSHAFHSALMEPMLAEFRRTLNDVNWQQAKLPMISNLTGSLAGEELSTADYWCRHLREPVRFCQGMEALGPLADLFLEMGPQPVLTRLGRQCLPDSVESAWLPSLRQGRDDWDVLLDSLAAMPLAGMEIDWFAFDRDYSRRRLPLPTYPFQRKRFWIDRPRGIPVNAAETKIESPTAVTIPRRHPLLQHRWRSPLVAQTVYESRLSLAELPFLADHQFCGTVIASATSFLVMAITAAQESLGTEAVRLAEVTITEALPLQATTPQRVQLIVTTAAAGDAEFQLISLAAEPAPGEFDGQTKEFQLHCRGQIGAGQLINGHTPLPTREQIEARSPQHLSRDEFYSAIRLHDVEMGDLFQSVEECWVGETELWGRVRVADGLDDVSGYAVHPAVLDSCLQLMPGGMSYDPALSFIPVGVQRLEFLATPRGTGLWCHSVLRPQAVPGDTLFTVDASLFDESGRLCVRLEGLKYQRLPKAALRRRITREAVNIVYETTWRRQPLSTTAASDDSGRWLILADRGGFGGKLQQLLEAADQECVLVHAADQFVRIDAQHYQLPVGDRAGLSRLLQETIGVSGQTFHGIVYLWALDDRLTPAGTVAVSDALHRRCGGLLALTQALLQEDWTALPPLTIATRGTQAVNGDAADLDLAGAALWGFGRTLDLEQPAWTCRRIDLHAVPDADETQQFLAELLRGYAEREVAFRGGNRHVPRLVRGQRTVSSELAVRPDRSYLITGGGGALGLKTAQWLVDQGARHLVLVNRSADAAAAQAAVSQWKSLGVHVTVAKCDVSVVDELAEVLSNLKTSQPSLAGIVHAAGILDDGAVDRLDWTRFQNVLSAKACGAWNLHRLTVDCELDFFVGYSSIAAGLGSPGQSSYAAANAFLDALVLSRQAGGRRSVSVQWGPWASGGMAAQLSETIRQQHQRRGLEPLDDSTAFEALSDLLRVDTALAMVVAIDWSKYRQRLPDGQPQPYLDVVAPFTAQASSEQMNFRRDWEAASPFERQHLVAELTRTLVGRAVGYDDVGGDDSFFDLGLDSLSSVQLRNDLQDYLSVELSSTLVFTYPTLNQLNSYLMQGVLELAMVKPQPQTNGQSHADAERLQHVAIGNGVIENTPSSLDALSEEELAAQLSKMLSAMQTENAS